MKQYLDLCNNILENGVQKSDRTGVGTISLFGTSLRFNLLEGFPAVTTKRLAFKSMKSELLWFLEGSTDERRLAEIHYGLPREELIGKTTIWTANADAQGKKLGYINTDICKELGPVYGEQWRSWYHPSGDVDQIKSIVSQLKRNPDSRRIILSAWNAGEINLMALPPCHPFTVFNVADGKLSCMMTMRSVDVFLGLPFNIASYALLTHMLAQVSGLEVGDLVINMADTHIYLNHVDQVRKQLTRTPFELPKLFLNPDIKDIDSFTMDDIQLIGYQSHDTIKAEMAV